MCNEYQRRVSRGQHDQDFSQLKIQIRWANAEPSRDLDTPLRPTDSATILRPINNQNPFAGLEGVDIRWWLVPFFHKTEVRAWRTVTTNARIETVDTSPTYRDAYNHRRCLVPLTSFVEYSTPATWRKGQPKMRHEISWPVGGVRYFAGLWERSVPADQPHGLESFAFVVGPAPVDVAPIHDSAPPVLTLEQGLEWLRLDGPGKAMLEPLPPPGTFILQERPRQATPIGRELRKAI